MKRKHNPWISLVALLLLVTLLVTVCTGCAVTEAEAEETYRFTVDNSQLGYGINLYVITDNETGAQYLFAESGRGVGLTVLQPAPAEEALRHGKE